MSGIEAQFRLDRPGFRLDVDLTLPGQGITAIYGRSGSGKTTLLRCVAGLERAAHARLVVAGQVWQDPQSWLPTHRRPLAYLFQEPSLFPHLSVLDNIQYGQRRSLADSGPAGMSLAQIIDLLGLGSLLNRTPDRLSGGERQRAGIARALAVRPRLLLMDEPLAALDRQRKHEILGYLDRVQQQLPMPVLYVTHAVDEVLRLADHLVVLERGQVRSQGPLATALATLPALLDPDEEACTLLEGRIASVDAPWCLAEVAFAGGTLWVRDQGLRVGQVVRVQIRACDVSLALEPGRTSIQNLLGGTVEAIHGDTHPAQVLVSVRVGTQCLLASLTRKAVAQLEIQPGKTVWAQVKTGALL